MGMPSSRCVTCVFRAVTVATGASCASSSAARCPTLLPRLLVSVVVAHNQVCFLSVFWGAHDHIPLSSSSSSSQVDVNMLDEIGIHNLGDRMVLTDQKKSQTEALSNKAALVPRDSVLAFLFTSLTKLPSSSCSSS